MRTKADRPAGSRVAPLLTAWLQQLTSPQAKNVGLGIVLVITCWTLATVSVWLIVPYGLLMAWLLIDLKGAKSALEDARGATHRSASARGPHHVPASKRAAEVVGPRSACAAHPEPTLPMQAQDASSLGWEGRVDGRIEQGETIPPDARRIARASGGRRRGSSRTRNAPASVVPEPVQVAWIQVGPGKFVRAEGVAPRDTHAPVPIDRPHSSQSALEPGAAATALKASADEAVVDPLPVPEVIDPPAHPSDGVPTDIHPPAREDEATCVQADSAVAYGDGNNLPQAGAVPSHWEEPTCGTYVPARDASAGNAAVFDAELPHRAAPQPSRRRHFWRVRVHHARVRVQPWGTRFFAGAQGHPRRAATRTGRPHRLAARKHALSRHVPRSPPGRIGLRRPRSGRSANRS